LLQDFDDNGHIAGAINVPSRSFDPGAVTDALAQQPAQHVVVLCGQSKHRAPASATKLTNALAAQSNLLDTVRVTVLDGGYEAFEQMYGSTALCKKGASA
jgi:rhodanese-related sulfurtransferase